MDPSQPETELASTDGELSNDDAVMARLMKEPEQGAKEGTEAEEVAEQEESAEEGEEQPEAAEEVAEEDDDPEYDLGDVKAKKSEILAWKAGEMKDADYRRKTAEAAEVKREAQAIAERVQQERSHYANQLDVFLQNLHTELVGDQAALAKLAVEDPAEWVAQNAAFQQRAAKFQQAMTERQALHERQQADSERQQQEWANAEREALKTKLPEWSDEKVARPEQEMIAKYLIEQGYSREEVSMLQDHRALLTARDAAKWREHMKSKESVKDKKVTTPPAKAIKPGAASTNTADQGVAKIEQLKARARRTGNQDDIAAYLMAKQGT